MQVTFAPPITVQDAQGTDLSYFFVNATIVCGRFEVGRVVEDISKVICADRWPSSHPKAFLMSLKLPCESHIAG